ncbi:hypothetical protein CUMW_210370 [Citrus unshiu]|uniref:Suppressor of forked domain-containing protein n=1 Tax=Citrus unshiu TaxID=55188 RepID=A0A2H5QA27_CITUN|nr:hypothetical protein CUMW_210370 [Citrus unshiu]
MNGTLFSIRDSLRVAKNWVARDEASYYSSLGKGKTWFSRFRKYISSPSCLFPLLTPQVTNFSCLQSLREDSRTRGVLLLDVESSNSQRRNFFLMLRSAYQERHLRCVKSHFERADFQAAIYLAAEKFQAIASIYLNYEQSSGDPGRVQLLYERAITGFPVSSDLWLDYTRYLDKTLKVGNVVRDVYSRATKNCPWVGEHWVPSLLSLERSRASEEEISTVFEKSLLCAFSTFEEYLDLFLTRIDGLRRRILFSGEVEGVLDYSLIRETFQHASDYLSEQMKNTNGLLHLYAYWARLEQSMGKDTVSARSVWERLLKISGTMLEAWQSYISMEIELGHINEARSIYKRCYSKRFTRTGSENSRLCFEGQTVAELGCGNGWITIAVAEKWLPLKFCWFVVLMPFYGLDINPRAIKISWIQLYLNALDESFSKLFRHCHCKRSFVLMVICGARKEGQPVYDAVLNSNSNAMSKIITENASEEFLYSLTIVDCSLHTLGKVDVFSWSISIGKYSKPVKTVGKG